MDNKEKISLLARNPALITLQYIKAVTIVIVIGNVGGIIAIINSVIGAAIAAMTAPIFGNVVTVILTIPIYLIIIYAVYKGGIWVYQAYQAEKMIESMARIQAIKKKQELAKKNNEKKN